MDYSQKIIGDIELHSADGLRECFEHGVSPNDLFKGKPLINELITEYGRGPGFRDCFKVFMEYGLVFDDKILLSVFLNDHYALDAQLAADKQAIFKKYSFDCAFTPLQEVSLLHICAEYNHTDCARVLVRHGVDVNVVAGVDENGFGGQTPVFHTVNQHSNKCIDTMNYLLSASADLSVTVKGLIWGKGYEWETFIPSVNPVSYAMMGLLRQFQRREEDVYALVGILMKERYGSEYVSGNVPNGYLVRG